MIRAEKAAIALWVRAVKEGLGDRGLTRLALTAYDEKLVDCARNASTTRAYELLMSVRSSLKSFVFAFNSQAKGMSRP